MKLKNIFFWILPALIFIQFGAAAAQKPHMASAIDFTLPSLEGKQYTLSQFKGKNPVLLVFFATWCPPCRREIPQLIDYQDRYASKGLKVMAINIDEAPDEVRTFAKGHGINYTVLLDEGAQVADKYSIRNIPTNILINKKGEVNFIGHTLPKNIEDVL